MPQTLSKGFITAQALPLVKLEGADIVNDGNLVLSDVSFEVSRGELVYLVGKVGSGKSSILKTLDAELPVTKGKVRVGDFDLSRIKDQYIIAMTDQAEGIHASSHPMRVLCSFHRSFQVRWLRTDRSFCQPVQISFPAIGPGARWQPG